MRKRSFAHLLLSLFTTRERADEIEGDLIEERAARGRAWFMRHVLGVTASLFRASCREAPLRVASLALVATIGALAATIACDRLLLAPDAWLQLPILGWFAIATATFVVGWAVGYFGSGFGIRATTCAVLVLTAFLIMTLPNVESVLVKVGLLLLSLAVLPLPLMVGSVVGEHRGG